MRSLTTLIAAATLALAVGIASPLRAAPPSKPAKPAKPKEREISAAYDLIHQTLFRPVASVFDVAKIGRDITGNPREAANVDEDDQVRLPSTWWQPRIGFRRVSVEQMLKGPGPGQGPAPGPWTVTKSKSEGVTPGFQIDDSKGDAFIIKFDPPNFPELATGADVIGSYVFWAAGYNVPENTIEWFRREDLKVAKDATYTDKRGRKHPMTEQYLSALLARVARRQDGSYRCVASRFLKGEPLGPFRYTGRRTDDPEDLIPHELRRELRGLWTMAAWVNHADSRAANSLDMWVTDGGRSFVRHYLIDFGSILGSSAMPRARGPATGFEYYVDYGAMARMTPTLGLYKAKWEDAVDPKIPAVGMIESKEFDPDDWRPDFPNPAFDERTTRDAKWGARIVAGFTDDHIRAAVAAAHYSNPAASDYMTRVLMERRDKLVYRWLGTRGPTLITSR
ncbi:MAG TPA: hypothetical protein VFQ05_16135 [Candidatus Eisenbacteria bacterium]|nr:hypothetical protein [Candidatus Eisenbacteria bacterium]